MHKYSVSVKWSDEDEGFIATMPELDGLSAFGNTKGEALTELEVAADAFLKSWENSGRPLPPPEKVLVYSGQLRLRMPKRLHARMVQSASVQGVSLNTYLVSLLSERQGEREGFELVREQLKSVIATLHRRRVQTASRQPGFEPKASIGPPLAVKEKKPAYRR